MSERIAPGATRRLSRISVVGLLVCVVYLQKVAIPGTGVSLAVAVPLVAIAAFGVGGGVTLWSGSSRLLVCAFFVFVSVLVSAQTSLEWSGGSYVLLLVCWSVFLFAIPRLSVDRWGVAWAVQTAMLPLAVLSILQYVLPGVAQRLDPFEALSPSWLVPGYQSSYGFYYGSVQVKSDGIFSLEPSFAAQYLALAVLVGLPRLSWQSILALIALPLTGGGTGFLMLGLGALILLGTFRARVRRGRLILALTLAVGISWWLGLSGLLLGRLGEFSTSGTSAHARFIAPWKLIGAEWSEHSAAFLFGRGPGFVDGIIVSQLVNFNTIAKALIEYGLIGGLALVLGVTYIVLHVNLETWVRLPLLLMFLLLSGALLQPHTSALLWVLAQATRRAVAGHAEWTDCPTSDAIRKVSARQ